MISKNSIVVFAVQGWARFGRVAALLSLICLSIMTQASVCRSSDLRSFLVDTSSPTVKFEGLLHYARAYTNVPLKVRATDDVGISRVDLYVDQKLHSTKSVGGSTDVLLIFDWNLVSSGKHSLQAKAYDAAGNAETATLIVVAKNLSAPTGNSISLNPAIRFQKMQGWEATDQAGQVDSPAFNNYKNTLFDQAVNDLGINRVRLEVFSGMENPTDYFQQMINGQITASQYFDRRYEIINDNSSPTTINPAGFKWSALDHAVVNVVLPLKQRLEARGETLWINVNYVDFDASQFEHKSNPAEYAEFVLATYKYLQTTYGLVPNSWEVILEPDTDSANWSQSQVAQAIKAAGDRLVANGFTPNFVAPSTTDAGNAAGYIDRIALTTGAMQYVSEFSYHRYSGGTNSILQNIADRAILHNKQTSMLEWIGADYHTLHQDLKVGQAASWQQFTLAYPDEPDNGAQYYLINDNNPNNPVVTIGSRTKFLRQYFRYIRLGAQRIQALSGNNNFDPLAFINTNGKYVVVVKATNGGSLNVQGLPAGSYGIKYTTESQYNVDLPDVTINPGQTLPASIPSAGVITVFAR